MDEAQKGKIAFELFVNGISVNDLIQVFRRHSEERLIDFLRRGKVLAKKIGVSREVLVEFHIKAMMVLGKKAKKERELRHSEIGESIFELGKKVLGEDFMSPGEFAQAFGVVFNEDQIKYLVKTFPSKELLQYLKKEGRYVILPTFPDFFVPNICTLAHPIFTSSEWRAYLHKVNDEKFGWLLIRKD